ncbi:MAG: FISUMP domain-containing protein [Crocinitomicaceae bacterium]
MKYLLSTTLLLISFISSNIFSQEMGTLTDERDGQTYKTVKIGDQTWLAENLRFKSDASYSYDKKEENDVKYGRYYSYESAQESCPTGWKLPSQEEYQVLSDHFGGDYDSGRKLKSTSDWFWTTNGDNSSGFNIIPAGSIYKGTSGSEGEEAIFWVNGKNDNGEGLIRIVTARDGNTDKAYKFRKSVFPIDKGSFSVRCLKE